LHGDLRNALGYNPLSIALLPFLGAAYLYSLAQAVGLRPMPWIRNPQHVAWVALAVILTFWLARNVPISPLSALAP
jgi:hypothetical protein